MLKSRVLMMASLRLDLLSQVVVIDTCWPLQTSCESSFGFLLSDILQDVLQPHSSLVWRFPDVFSSWWSESRTARAAGVSTKTLDTINT